MDNLMNSTQEEIIYSEDSESSYSFSEDDNDDYIEFPFYNGGIRRSPNIREYPPSNQTIEYKTITINNRVIFVYDDPNFNVLPIDYSKC